MQVLQPAIPRLRPFEVKKPRVNQLLDVHLAVLGLKDLGPVVQLLDKVNHSSLGLVIDLDLSPAVSLYSVNTYPLKSTYHVNLVEDNHIRKLNLVNHEIRDRPLILGGNIVPPSRQQIHGIEVMHHRKGINDRDRRI